LVQSKASIPDAPENAAKTPRYAVILQIKKKLAHVNAPKILPTPFYDMSMLQLKVGHFKAMKTFKSFP
jgi:hypothetical protein